MSRIKPPSFRRHGLAVGLGLVGLLIAITRPGRADRAAAEPKNEYGDIVQPLLKKYCLDCHSTKAKKGSLDLERFSSLDVIRKDTKPWQMMIEMLETNEMPPKDKPQPTAEERKKLIAWTKNFLDSEARARSGDPGRVPLRRLSNAEYDATIRDLTGVDLRPTREFPADGAGGEGFTNAAESLTDISPALLTKYLNAAKDVSEHLVLLPEGFRFSPSKTRRDWTDESTAELRRFYAPFGPEGRLPLMPYLSATLRHREALTSGALTTAEAAGKEKLNAKYLGVLWKTLTDKTPSQPLDAIRARWRAAGEKDAAALTADIASRQAALWKIVPIGSYRYGATSRQAANDPAPAAVQPVKLSLKPAPGQSEVLLRLTARDLDGGKGVAIWQRPRFERAGKKTLLLRDYDQWGTSFEIDHRAAFVDTVKYLSAAVEAANDKKSSVAELAKKHEIDAAFLARWIDVLDVKPLVPDKTEPRLPGRTIPTVALDLLTEKAPKNDAKPAINGWRRKGTDLPIVSSNSSDRTENVPGRMDPHKVVVHPTPQEFVAVTWTSPIDGEVRIAAGVVHVHPACGNGVAWWLEHRRGKRAGLLDEGTVDLGKSAVVPSRTMKVAKGDQLILAVDARASNHICDLTQVALTISETDKPKRVWDLAADVADNVLDGNPHADKLGNKDVWSFVKGPAKPQGHFQAVGGVIPSSSLLGQWREAAPDPERKAEVGKLAERVRELLTGARPVQEKHPDRVLYDNLLAPESPLFRDVDLTQVTKKPTMGRFGPAKDRFGKHPEGKPLDAAALASRTGETIEIRLPAALFLDRDFAVDGTLDAGSDRLVHFQATDGPPGAAVAWDGKSPVATTANSPAYKKLIQGHDEFRRTFPLFLCFPQVIPTDEVVSLKMFHREDEPLVRLFLDDEQKSRIDRLWNLHRFVSRQAIAENEYLPQFIGYVTQDQPKELLDYFESQRPVFRKRAEELEKELTAAEPKQMDALMTFVSRVYRRPLSEREKTDLSALYSAIRKKGTTHEEAFRGVVARVLVSPAFLFKIERAPAGKEPKPIDDWELASRLSYFLWSSAPDDELRQLAAAGRLRDPKVLTAQTQRMLKDDRVRSLAIEFGTQWLHVRGFDELKEKNEKLFPTFDVKLRKAIYEESILFFQDLFQNDRSTTNILDADYTFLNETLAKHYAIPGVVGEQWRKVDGVRKHGRGGILGLASVQAKESGASRTSPVLRGNWVVETLLGEKLPRPPANVPRLPEEEKGNDGLTMRQLVEKHAKAAECAVCHQRIDPYGFALEKYDPIGRLREKDLGGLAVDAKARLRDGTQFEGIDGLRSYLTTRKKDVIERLFCRKLLGYALGRSVTLSDQALLDEMVVELKKSDGRLSAAVLAIVRSRQFLMIRGADEAE